MGVRPLCARCRAVRLHVRAVDQHLDQCFDAAGPLPPTFRTFNPPIAGFDSFRRFISDFKGGVIVVEVGQVVGVSRIRASSDDA